MAASAKTPISRTQTTSLYKPYSSSPQLPFKLLKLTPTPCAAKGLSICCALQMEPKVGPGSQVPDSFGRFGKFGGKYVPETLMHALTELESAFRALSGDVEFQVLSFFFFSFYLGFRFLVSIEIVSGFLLFLVFSGKQLLGFSGF